MHLPPQLTQLHDDLWVVQRPLSFLGVPVGARMTVVRFGRRLLLHSPVAPDPLLLASLADLGEVRWVVGPNRFHHLYLHHWIDLGAEAWAVPSLPAKRPDLRFAGIVGDGQPWARTLETHQMSCMPFADESVFFHAPSRTLVVTDLLFNIAATAPLITRSAMWMAGSYPGVRCSHLERVLFKRAEARRDLQRILGWDFDRIVLAHGDVVETGGHKALRNAYRWLGIDVALS